LAGARGLVTLGATAHHRRSLLRLWLFVSVVAVYVARALYCWYRRAALPPRYLLALSCTSVVASCRVVIRLLIVLWLASISPTTTATSYPLDLTRVVRSTQPLRPPRSAYGGARFITRLVFNWMVARSTW